jgi:hypothetical protein
MKTSFLIFFIIIPYSFSISQNINSLSKIEINNLSIEASQGDSTKSPGKAVIMSAVLPGLGQFYNESYWKIPIVYGLGAFFVYEYSKYNKDFNNYSNQFEASKTGDNPGGSYYLKSYREFYRDKRDSFIWYGGFLYLINIVDALVDAHLYNFDVNENVSLGLTPNITNKAFYLKIRF